MYTMGLSASKSIDKTIHGRTLLRKSIYSKISNNCHYLSTEFLRLPSKTVALPKQTQAQTAQKQLCLEDQACSHYLPNLRHYPCWLMPIVGCPVLSCNLHVSKSKCGRPKRQAKVENETHPPWGTEYIRIVLLILKQWLVPWLLITIFYPFMVRSGTSRPASACANLFMQRTWPKMSSI